MLECFASIVQLGFHTFYLKANVEAVKRFLSVTTNPSFISAADTPATY